MTDYSKFDTSVKVRWNRVVLTWAVIIACFVGITCLAGCDTAEASTGMDRAELNAHMEPYFEQVVDAIYLAEGGKRAVKPFGILSVSCSDYADCRQVCMNTVRNNYHRWITAGRQGEYLAFLARQYCPVGASNDPQGLNRHWLGNVTKLIERA